LQDLALCALPAIDQEAKFIVDDHLAGKPTVDGRSGSRRAKEDDFEQRSLWFWI
jgi:hypothetical protein